MTDEQLHDQTFKRYAREYLDNLIREMTEELHKKLEQSFLSGAIPEKWKDTGNYLLPKAIIHSYCMDDPYKALNNKNLKEQNNIHKFI